MYCFAVSFFSFFVPVVRATHPHLSWVAVASLLSISIYSLLVKEAMRNLNAAVSEDAHAIPRV
jgi:hypothetical protein